MTTKPTVHITDSGGRYFSLCVWLSFVKNSSFRAARTTWNGLWCSRWGRRKCVSSHRLIAAVGRVARTLECWSRLCSIRDGQNGETARGWTRQVSMSSLSHCVSKSVMAWAQNIKHHFSSFTFFCFTFFHFGSVPLRAFAGAVILGRVSPGSAGSEHWTKSSSGGLPESRPSWPAHCREDEIMHSLEPLLLLLV